MQSCNKTIIFEWIAGHSGIAGNDVADTAAKRSIITEDITNIPLIYDDFKFLAKSLINEQWQLLWSRTDCKLKSFKPVLGDWKSAYRDNRVEEKILSRLRTGCCYFLYQHKIDTEDRVKECCNACNTDMTIEHLLVTCPALQQARRRISSHLIRLNLALSEFNILNDSFNHDLLFDFLREVGFYKKI